MSATRPMTPKQLEITAKFYGISMEEAVRRYELVQGQGDNPLDPICIGCAKRPEDLPIYDSYIEGAMTRIDAVIQEEGTYNSENGHFLCDECYIKNGSPSRSFPNRWVCP